MYLSGESTQGVPQRIELATTLRLSPLLSYAILKLSEHHRFDTGNEVTCHLLITVCKGVLRYFSSRKKYNSIPLFYHVAYSSFGHIWQIQ